MGSVYNPADLAYRSIMDRRITGFRQDEEHHWVADLECGHAQQVRHDPPWQSQPWVLHDGSRRERLGSTLPCPLCDSQPTERPAATGGTSFAVLDPYTDARLQGLCHDGAAELARQARLRKPDPKD